MITVIGSSNTDFVVRAKSFPRPGETVLGCDFVMAKGGKGANQAVQIARLGHKVAFVANIGKDHFGDEAVKEFKRLGVDTSFIVRDSKYASGVALIILGKAGENRIVVAPGSNAHLKPSHIRAARKLIEKSGVVLLQLEIPLDTVSAALNIADKSGVRVILNSAPAKKLPDKVLSKVDILVPNEVEFECLCGVTAKNSACVLDGVRKLFEKGVGSVVLTCGAKGAIVLDRSGMTKIPAKRVKVVDTTAAGDSFCGALAVAVAEGKDLHSAVRFATMTASLSVMRLGAQPSLPTRRELKIC